MTKRVVANSTIAIAIIYPFYIYFILLSIGCY